MNVFLHLTELFVVPASSAQDQVVKLKCHVPGQGWGVLVLDTLPASATFTQKPSKESSPCGIPFYLGFLSGCGGLILTPVLHFSNVFGEATLQ
jgi:hypothetical protein